MVELSKKDMLNLAHLARIELSDDEVAEFSKDLNTILVFIEQLKDVDTNGLKPTYQVTGLINVMRDDVPLEYGYQPNDLLKNVPRVMDNQIKTNRMVE